MTVKQETKNQFVKLIRENEGIIYKVAFLYTDNATDRDDLYQEILLQAWKGLSRFRGDAAFSTWLYQVALNTAIAGFKRQKRSENLFVHLEKIPDRGDPERDHTQEEQLKLLKEAISALNEIEKAIVMLFLEGQSYERMEVITGITSGTLRVKMNRIKEKLRNLVQQKTYGN